MFSDVLDLEIRAIGGRATKLEDAAAAAAAAAAVPVFDETMATTEGVADPAQLVAATPAATGFEAGAAATGGGYEASWEGGQPDAAASQW